MLLTAFHVLMSCDMWRIGVEIGLFNEFTVDRDRDTQLEELRYSQQIIYK